MIKTITKNDIAIVSRPHGGFAIEQGPSHILLTAAEAAELGATLVQLTTNFQK